MFIYLTLLKANLNVIQADRYKKKIPSPKNLKNSEA